MLSRDSLVVSVTGIFLLLAKWRIDWSGGLGVRSADQNLFNLDVRRFQCLFDRMNSVDDLTIAPHPPLSPSGRGMG